MNHNSIKLIVSDLDGTLLDGNHRVPAVFFDQVHRLYEKGIRVAIASGRQYHNLLENFAPVADKIFFIADNGAFAMEREEVFHTSFLDWDLAFDILKKSSTIDDVTIVLSCENSTYYTTTDKTITNDIANYYKECKCVSDFRDIDTTQNRVLKVALLDAQNAKTNSLKHFVDFHKDVAALPSNVHWLDIAAKKSNKGYALKTLQDRLGVSEEQTMAFGDYHNDIQMLQQAKYSFAVATAQEEVKAVVKYMAPSNIDLGVVQVVDKLLNAIDRNETSMDDTFSALKKI